MIKSINGLVNAIVKGVQEKIVSTRNKQIALNPWIQLKSYKSRWTIACKLFTLHTKMTIDIIFFNERTQDKVARVNMCMSHFEDILLSFDFERHSKEKYWDYDEYGYVEDKCLTRLVWWGCVKAGYISEGHSLLVQLAPLVMRIE